jgi:GH24 family phage-related lysozyme (muramidase)
MYHISPEGIALIKRWEGCKLEAYRCAAGRWTIGYGHTKTAFAGMKISQDEAEKLLLVDLAECERHVNGMVTVPITQGQYDALVSMAFNMGPSVVRSSPMVRELEKGNVANAAAAIPQYSKTVGGIFLPGLLNRRCDELRLFLGGK